MPASKRSLKATAALTETPPANLPPSQVIARVVKGVGNNLYNVTFPAPGPLDNDYTTNVPDNESPANVQIDKIDTSGPASPDPFSGLVELGSKFRNKIWLKRGGYVVIDRSAFAGRDNKLVGEIVNVVREEKEWMKQDYWPREFTKKPQPTGESDEEESIVGKMPPSSDTDENGD